MDRIAIEGGVRLEGVIPISGAKNSAIKLMAASLLTDEPLRVTNMPRLADTRFLGRLLQRLGAEVVEQEAQLFESKAVLTGDLVGPGRDVDRVAITRRGDRVLEVRVVPGDVEDAALVSH